MTFGSYYVVQSCQCHTKCGKKADETTWLVGCESSARLWKGFGRLGGSELEPPHLGADNSDDLHFLRTDISRHLVKVQYSTFTSTVHQQRRR